MPLPTTATHKPPSPPSGEQGRPAFLVAFPRSAGMALSFGEPLGREWLAEAGIEDGEVSGAHIELRRVGARVELRDVGSRNGTRVDGRPLAANRWERLADGAVVVLGSTVLVFREGVVGPYRASGAMGGLVGPYGLREVERLLEAMKERPPATVLIRGETGTGKEMLAREVAARLGRAGRYVAVNVAGIAEGVFESQLFGHVAGAFSGAGKAAKGVVVEHDGGAVFLDELGELAMGLQPKLLRLVENGEVLPVGAAAPVRVDVALIAATHAPLERMVDEGRFRQDLLARLEPWTLSLPSLRARREDVFAIAQALAPSIGIALSPERCEVEAVERLLLEWWPTNVRGLSAALTKVRAIDPEAGLRLWALEKVLGPVRRAAPGEVDETAAREAVAACGGNESEAARVLGISRGRLRRVLGKG